MSSSPMLDKERADLALQFIRMHQLDEPSGPSEPSSGPSDEPLVRRSRPRPAFQTPEQERGESALSCGDTFRASVFMKPAPASSDAASAAAAQRAEEKAMEVMEAAAASAPSFPAPPPQPPPPPGAPPLGPPAGQPDQPWREDPDYDPYAERVVRLPYSNVGALAHLLKGALGAGLLAISLGFKMSGLAVGVVSGIVIAVVCTHCCTLLVHSSQMLCKRLRVPSLDFPSTVEAAFLTSHARFRRYARFCRFMVNFMLCFTYLGLPIIFIVVISSSVQQLVQYYTGVELNVRFYILMLVPFVMGMGLIRELKWLVPVSHTSNALFLVGLSTTMYFVLKDCPSPLEARQTGAIGDYPLFLSAMIYGMENVGVILPVENTMRRPKDLVAGKNVLIWSMFIIAFCYIFIGAAGFVAFGEATRENIILNLNPSEPAAQAVKVIIPLAVLLSYGLQLYVVPVTLWNGLQHRVPQNWPQTRRDAALSLLRAATVLFTVMVALIMPNLRPVLALVGAIGFSSLGLLFPALVDLVTHWQTASALRVAKDLAIMLFWLVALLSGTYSAFLEIIDTYFSAPQTS